MSPGQIDGSMLKPLTRRRSVPKPANHIRRQIVLAR
jgi:hypothetical protein